MTIRIHAEPVKAGLTRRLAVFGNELIYETPGDTKRGNPLDIIVVATCYDCEDVTRETAYAAKETAKRLARLWNAAIHPDDHVAELVAALDRPAWLVWSNEHAAWWGSNRRGYFMDIEAAGRYTLQESMALCRQRSQRPGENPTELIQPSPELVAALAKYKATTTKENEHGQAIP